MAKNAQIPRKEYGYHFVKRNQRISAEEIRAAKRFFEKDLEALPLGESATCDQ